MRRTIWARLLPALVVLTAVFAGCGDDDDDDDTTDTTDAPAEDAGNEAEAIEVTAVDYAFDGLPDEIAGGNVTVHMTNEGKTGHEIAFINIGDEANAAKFFDDFGPVIEGGAAWPDYVTNVAGANEAEPGADFTATYQLDPGTYMVFCALSGTTDSPDEGEDEEGPPHFTQGMQQIVTVTEGEITDLPEADGTITAKDYEFDVDLSAGDQVINFVNEGPNDHFADIQRFPDGTSVENAEAAIEASFAAGPEGSPPEGTPEPEEVGFSGITSEGKGIQFELAAPLEPGVYAFMCFISDRAGGPPHAIGNHMWDVIEIA